MKSFLLFLILVTHADDALALTTPTPDDDVVAAENNEYLALPDPDWARCSRHESPSPATPLLPNLSPFLTPSFSGPPARGGILPRPGPGPLYVLMSLQR